MYNPANDPRITDAVHEDRSVLVTAATERDQWRAQALRVVEDVKTLRAKCQELDNKLAAERAENERLGAVVGELIGCGAAVRRRAGPLPGGAGVLRRV